VTTDEFITTAIARGAKEGFRALSEKQRVIFLVSEAEVLCAMEGIDTLLDWIEREELCGVSDAFAAIGAGEIATCLARIEQALPARDDAELMHANRLITSCAGYSYETIQRYTEKT
jgi:hypothetical protein